MFNRLVEYREIHGDCLVPSDYSQDEELARWVEEQRSGLKDGSVASFRIERLDAIGFLMTKEKYAQHWNRQFKSLVSYQRKHGTTVVGHPTAGRLLRWTGAQRYLHRNKLMSKEHERKLQSIGFEWQNQPSSCTRERSSATPSRRDRTASSEDESSSEDEWSSDDLSDDESVLQDSDTEGSIASVQRARKKLLSRRDLGTETDATGSDCSPRKRRRRFSRISGGSAQAENNSANRGVEAGGRSHLDTQLPASNEIIAEKRSPNASVCSDVDTDGSVDRQMGTQGEAERITPTSNGGYSPVSRPECVLHAHADQESRDPEASDGLYSVCDLIDNGDDGRERVDCSVLYPTGTRVRKYYDCYGWITGEIAEFEGVYRVRYEDGDEEDFLSDDKELEEIVLHAQSKRQPTTTQGLCSTLGIMPMGTPVYKHFPRYGWFAGAIVAFDGLYLVRHDDGDEEELFYDSPEVARIVANANNNPRPQQQYESAAPQNLS